MTSINVGVGAGAANWYDDVIEASGGVPLEGAFFSGTNYLEAQSGNLNYESYTYTLSFWYKIREDLPIGADEKVIFNIQNCRCELYGLKVWLQYDEEVEVLTLNVLSSSEDQSQRSQFRVEDPPTHDDIWHHVIIYEQSYPAISRIYIDAVLQTRQRLSIITRSIPFSFPNQWRVGAGDDSTSARYNGCLDQVYFTLEDLDIGISDNLDKFISLDTFTARYLGPIGERPTGNQAVVYLKDLCENFYINYGNLPIPYSAYGELACCDEEIIDLYQGGMIFDDPNKPCGWIIRDPKVYCEIVDINEVGIEGAIGVTGLLSTAETDSVWVPAEEGSIEVSGLIAPEPLVT